MQAQSIPFIATTTMPTTPSADDILIAAAERAKAANLPYAGAVTPTEAHALAQQGRAKIVDVRSRFENEYIGRIPDTPLVEWKRWEDGRMNENFLPELAAKIGKDETVLFLCRSGGRSHSAAALAVQNGYAHAYNILEGFEGDLDTSGQRNKIGGWRKAGLPWVQS